MKLRFFIIIILAFINVVLFAQDNAVIVPDSTLRMAYSIKNITALSITNIYGDIAYEGTSGDSIIVEVTIKLENPEEEFAEIYDMINIKSAITKKTLELKTVFSNSFSSSNTFSVSYKIKGTEDLTLFVNNQFGNIVINESGNVDATINHGNITISKPFDKLKLNLKNGYAKLPKVEIVNATIANSQLAITETANMEINAEFSNVNIGKAGTVKIQCNTGELSFSEVDDISVTGNLCFLKIDSLHETGYFEMENGSLSVNNILQTVNNFSASLTKTPVNLSMSSSMLYALHGEISNGNLHHPQMEKIRLLVENGITSFSGLIGNDKSNETTTSVIIFSEGADIIFN